VAYRGGVPVPEQPRLLTQPAPFGTRYQFLYQTIYSQLAMPGSAGTGGDAYWLIVDRDDEGLARAAIVLDPDEVVVSWDADRFLPEYTWRGQRQDRDLVHLTIGRPPGELHGRSPLIAGLPALSVVAAAEAYALGFFTTSGVPSVDILVPGKVTADEAIRLKAQYQAGHNVGEPAVLSNGIDTKYPNVDAQRAQMQESRAYGATIVARLLGIPAPLLHVETSGATITYNNAGGALDEFVRATAAPVYLAPLEGYLSALMPRTQTVRFDTGELSRIDVAGRFNVYQAGIAAGVMTPAEARMNEGWPTDTPIAAAPAYAATPALPAVSVEVPSV
jgi:HK97 family phage portal protein